MLPREELPLSHRAAETPRFFGGPQVEAGGGEGRPYACLAAAEPSQRAHSSSRSPGDRTPAGLWPGSRSCVQSREETAEIDRGGGRKVRGNEALHVCSMMLFTLPSFYLLLATSSLALSSHHRRHLVFAYTASPGPVSNPRRRLAGRLCVFVSFSEQLLCRALCRPPLFPPPAPSLLSEALKGQRGFPCGHKWLSACRPQALAGCVSERASSRWIRAAFCFKGFKRSHQSSQRPCCSSPFILPHFNPSQAHVAEYRPWRLLLNGWWTW